MTQKRAFLKVRVRSFVGEVLVLTYGQRNRVKPGT